MSNNNQNLIDKAGWITFIVRVEMNTTFAKYIKMHLPVNGHMTCWQQASRHFGIVGTNS